MFSQGQIIFSIAFVVVFVIAMIYVYRKDMPLHKTHYKGSMWILISIFVFVGLLFAIKTILKQ